MAYGFVDPCTKCEEMMQPYLDHELTDAEREEAEMHLAACEYCARRYRFEVSLRRYVHQAAAAEPMPVELKQRLSALRTEL